mmetsp:Transcript_51486/g.109500  ORF Transcript_51486/g.109500 Transcript_51486/m.109500 type:complete len:241 (+) Transcript_51486:393-1115(+)
MEVRRVWVRLDHRRLGRLVPSHDGAEADDVAVGVEYGVVEEGFRNGGEIGVGGQRRLQNVKLVPVALIDVLDAIVGAVQLQPVGGEIELNGKPVDGAGVSAVDFQSDGVDRRRTGHPRVHGRRSQFLLGEHGALRRRDSRGPLSLRGGDRARLDLAHSRRRRAAVGAAEALELGGDDAVGGSAALDAKAGDVDARVGGSGEEKGGGDGRCCGYFGKKLSPVVGAAIVVNTIVGVGGEVPD